MTESKSLKVGNEQLAVFLTLSRRPWQVLGKDEWFWRASCAGSGGYTGTEDTEDHRKKDMPLLLSAASALGPWQADGRVHIGTQPLPLTLMTSCFRFQGKF